MKDIAPARVRFGAGDFIRPRTLQTIDGASVSIPDPGGALVHLQFRRYAGCPICSLHLRSFTQRHEELVAAGIREVVVFHSPEAELRKVHRLPFAVIADPDKRLYAEFGVGTSPRAVLDPRVWPTALRAVAARASADPKVGRESGSFGLPADFLIAPEGRVRASKYGVHADDQWSVDELLRLLGETERAPLAARANG
jgi:peroxiredoxin